MKEREEISSFDVGFDPLAHVQRRKLLVALLEGDSREEVTVILDDSDGEYSVTEHRLPISQDHLSELAENGCVEWDTETHEVSAGPNFDEISPVLESLTNRRRSGGDPLTGYLQWRRPDGGRHTVALSDWNRFVQVMGDLVDLVERSLRDATRSEFDRRVDEQAARLADALRAERLDNPTFGLGIEIEAYAVDESLRLTRVPDAAFEGPCDKELGRHNVEFHTDPTPFDGEGVAAQASQLRRRYQGVRRAVDPEGAAIVLDAMWTIPPPEGSRAYLADVRETDGVSVAENMTPSPRYCAIDNDVLARTGGEIALSVPGVERRFPSILFESLASSIQPHLQVPDVDAYPRYFNTAVRTLGPVLALATNSPLLPPDLYDADDPYRLLDDTFHELRVPVFEQSINRAWEKVRFPGDVEAAADTVDDLVADPTCAPFLREWLVDDDRESFGDLFWELDHKRGTYWRWLRTVIGGQPVDRGDQWSVRMEYRPLPTQPTVVENVGFQCLVAGLVRGLRAADHPLDALDRDAAERSFYDAVERGLDADLAWVTVDGDRTTDSAAVYEEVFEFARRGLREQGVPSDAVEEYLAPLEARWDERTTPSRWKLARVRDHLDAGAGFAHAVREMQSEYVRRSAAGEPVVKWS